MIEIIRNRFCDVNQYANSRADSPLTLIQLDKGNIEIKKQTILFDDYLKLFRIQCDKKLLVKNDYSPDTMRLNFPIYPEVTEGMEISKGDCIIYKPDEDYRAILSNKYEAYEIEISNSFLLNWFPEVIQSSIVRSNKIKISSINEFNNYSVDRMKFIFRLFESNEDHLFERYIFDILDQLILDCLENIFNYEHNFKCDKKASHWNLFMEIIDYISNNYDEISVYELSQRFSVSNRTIYTIFKNFVGLSPVQYILYYKLCLSRSYILNAGSSKNPVTEAALSSHFYHLGRFSGYYREFFGERPMDTARRVCEIIENRR